MRAIEYAMMGLWKRLGPVLTWPVRRIDELSTRVEAAVVAYFRQTPRRSRIWEFLVALERHSSLRTASAMAFDLFLASVPMLGLAGYAVARLLHSRPLALVEGSRLLDLAPARLRDFIAHNMTAFAETDLAPLFVLSALWLSSSAFITMIRVFEESFDCEPRNWLVARALALGFAGGGLLLFVAATGAGALMAWEGFTSEETRQQIAKVIEISPHLVKFPPIGLFALIASSIGVAGYLALIYRFSIVRKVRRRYIPGALIATVMGLLVSALFAYYAANLARYALFYGGLAAVVVVLLWLWLWCSVILVGAEINFALENATMAPRPSRERIRRSHGAEPTQTPSAAGNPEGD